MLNENPLISVIVPVYKVAQYLHRCNDSILAQTYTNLEIILVDDGSPDRSGEICDEYATKDSRIKVIHQENRGLSAARNAGLDICTGAYIAFVDSDDYIMPQMYEQMLAASQDHNVDICVCQWQYECPDGTLVIDPSKIDTTILGVKSAVHFAEYLYKKQYESGTVCVVWNKLYKRKVLSDISFLGRYVEDERIHNFILSRDYSVMVIPELLYIYCQNVDSLTNKPFRKDNLMYLDVLLERAELFDQNGFISFQTWKRYCDMYVEYYYKANVVGIEMPGTADFDKMFLKLLATGKCDVKFYLRMVLFRMAPNIYNNLLIKKRMRSKK